MMAEFPALPLWTDAYLADCGHLTDAEHGRYFLLLMAMWRVQDCRLPNDDDWLARRFRRSVDEIQSQFRPLIAEFCQSTGNWITQKRLARERAHVRARARARSDSAKARWNKEKGACDRNAPTPTPTPTPTLSEEDKSSSGGAPPFGNGPAHEDEGVAPETACRRSPGPEKFAPDPKKPLFDLGREIFGKKSGGQVTRLIGAHGGDLDATMATMERARQQRSDPAEYLSAIIHGKRQPETDWDAEYRRMGVSL